jgi:hypothetical protein
VGGIDADELKQRAAHTLSRLRELAG